MMMSRMQPRLTRGPSQHSRMSPICHAAASKSYRLWYFPLPARAETTRLLFTVGKVPFEDKRVPREQWAELKTKMPYGQMPVLEVDGTMLAQQGAIERYVARTVGLYPEDAWEAAQVDSMVSFMTEFQEAFLRTFFIKDAEEKLAARKEVVEGPLATKLSKLDSMLSALGPNGYLVGSKLTWADLAAFHTLSFLVSGFLDGVPKDLYNKYPQVKAYRSRIASLPEIKAYYEAQEDDPIRAAYLP